jgi:hypothetical protein
MVNSISQVRSLQKRKSSLWKGRSVVEKCYIYIFFEYPHGEWQPVGYFGLNIRKEIKDCGWTSVLPSEHYHI